MRTRVVAAVAVLLPISAAAFAHRVDEYLQATIISVEKDRIHAQVRLTPGVAVFPSVLAGIDRNGDGLISETERRAYAERVLRDLSLTIDGEPVRLRLVSSRAAGVEEMREGRGDIQLEVEADVPRGGGHRRLRFENHHQSRIAAYLVNCLVPSDPDIRVTAQSRNYEQSVYELGYGQTGESSGPLRPGRWAGVMGWLGTAALAVGLTRVAVLRVSPTGSVRPRRVRPALLRPRGGE
jgi:hypothetical protein